MSVPIRVECVVSPLFDQNAYIVWREGATDAVVFDPGFDSEAIVRTLQSHGLTPTAVVNTHGHSDHIAGNAAVLAAFPGLPLIIGRNEAHLLTDPKANLSAAFGFPITSPEATRLVDDGEAIELAGIAFEVREIPGHSPGSVVFIASGESPPIVLVGDVIFSGSVGRTDFPGGSSERLFSGIRSKLFPLPDETVLYPGHGPMTTVGQEKASNPFVGGA